MRWVKKDEQNERNGLGRREGGRLKRNEENADS